MKWIDMSAETEERQRRHHETYSRIVGLFNNADREFTKGDVHIILRLAKQRDQEIADTVIDKLVTEGKLIRYREDQVSMAIMYMHTSLFSNLREVTNA
jgi:hypothetical protein